MDDFIIALNKYAPLAPTLPFLIGVIGRSRIQGPKKILLLMVVFSGMIEIGAALLSTYAGNNLPLHHLYVTGEFCLLSLIFSRGFDGLLSNRHHLRLVVFFILLAILNIIFFQPLNTYASNIRTVESVVLIFLAARYFYLVLKALSIPNLEKSFMFWFASAILLHFSTNFLLYIYSNFIMEENPRTFFEVWAIHSFLNIILYTLYSIALLCPLQPRSLRFS